MIKKFGSLARQNVSVVAAVILFILLISSNLSIVLSSQQYFVIHLVLEIFAVIVSFSIAVQGWMIFPHLMSRQRIYLSGLFLIVGLFDLSHIIVYDGISEWSSVQLATWFWIAARLIGSAGLLTILLMKDLTAHRSERRYVFSAAAGIYGLLLSVLLLLQDSLPLLVISGQGTTLFKNGLEYFVIILNAAAIFLIIYKQKYIAVKSGATTILVKALCFLIMSGLFFTLYQEVSDLLNLAGHVFKIVGYTYLMKGTYLSYIEEPYLKQKKIEKELVQNQRQSETIMAAIGEGLLVVDQFGMLSYMNPEAERLLGWRSEELLGRNLHESIHYLKEDGSPYPWTECQIKDSLINRTDSRSTDVYVRKDGTMFHIEYVSKVIIDEVDRSCAVIVFRDTTEERAKQERIRILATYDELTGLINRSHYLQLLTEAISSAKDSGEQLAVLLLDIDRFKYVNDSLGHDMGDSLLTQVSKRLLHVCLTNNIILARMGGDEFLLMVKQVNDEKHLQQIGELILEQFDSPFQLNGANFYISASIGISVYPEHGEEKETLIKHADIAMYSAKAQRKHYRIYHPDMSCKSAEMLQLENDLCDALERGELELYYQPQMDVLRNECIGVEALLRWRHPHRGWISPAEFVPLAEDTGLIVSIERWVLSEACKQWRTWREQGLMCRKISVNISNKLFHSGFLHDLVAGVLKDNQMAPEALDLEITERVMMHKEPTAVVLQQLKQLGVHISIDDFGTGYSSLSFLKEFPIDRLKIDQSFIRGLNNGEREAAIVKTIIAMTHSLGLDVIAEGVETKEELEFLRRQTCYGVQGYYFSKPLPAQAIESFLARYTLQ